MTAPCKDRPFFPSLWNWKQAVRWEQPSRRGSRQEIVAPGAVLTSAGGGHALYLVKKNNKKKDRVKKPDVEFEPSPQEIVDKMLALAQVKKGDLVYDLGCGDGRIVITAARKYGARGVGYEIDSKLFRQAKKNVKRYGVEDLVIIEQKDILKVDLRDATVVTLFLSPQLNQKLLPQLEQLKPGARVVSHWHGIKGVRPKHMINVKNKKGETIRLYLWVAPLGKAE
jgi:precorrin-6B methylase 2